LLESLPAEGSITGTNFPDSGLPVHGNEVKSLHPGKSIPVLALNLPGEDFGDVSGGINASAFLKVYTGHLSLKEAE